MGAVLLVCPGGLSVGWRGVAGPGFLVGALRPAGGRAGGPFDLSWSPSLGRHRGRVNPSVPVGATGSGHASDAPL